MFNFSRLHKYCWHQEQGQWKREVCVCWLSFTSSTELQSCYSALWVAKNDQQWRESQTFPLLFFFFFSSQEDQEGGATHQVFSFLFTFLPFQCLSSISWHNFHIKRWRKKNKDLLQKLVMKRLCLNPGRRLDALKSYSDNHKIWTKKSHYRGFRRFSCSKLPARPL